MKYQMQTKAKKCLDYSKNLKRTWELYCISKDSYLSGYDQALKDVHDMLRDDKILAVGSEPIEVEIPDGEHQIGAKLVDHE